MSVIHHVCGRFSVVAKTKGIWALDLALGFTTAIPPLTKAALNCVPPAFEA
jgi:hypothetical protein